jgi:hypothetical protein
MTLDLRGIPTAACPNCGSTLFNINASFDVETYEIEMYLLDCKCAECGSLLTAPTPPDHLEATY